MKSLCQIHELVVREREIAGKMSDAVRRCENVNLLARPVH